MDYLPPLRLFETILVTRYLSLKEKLQIISHLNKAWRSLIFENFIWNTFPKSLTSKALLPYTRFLSTFNTLQGISISLFNERLFTEHSLTILSKASELAIPFAFKHPGARNLLMQQPDLLHKIIQAPLLARQDMIFVDIKKSTTPDYNLQIPPSCFVHLVSLRQAFLKYDESSELASLASLSHTLQDLELDLVQEDHNSSKVFNLDFKPLFKLKRFRITKENIIVPVSLNLSNLPESLEELEITQFKAPALNDLDDQLERLFKKTKGKFNLKKIKVNALISSQFLQTLSFLKNIQVLGISCDETVKKLSEFKILKELTILEFKAQQLEFQKLSSLRYLSVDDGMLQFAKGIENKIIFKYSSVQGLSPYFQNEEIKAYNLNSAQTIAEQSLQPAQLKSASIESLTLHKWGSDKKFATYQENFINLKHLELKFKFIEEEYDLKLENYPHLEHLEIINTNNQESLWFFEIKNCPQLTHLKFQKVHSLSLTLDNSLQSLDLKVSRKLKIETENPSLRIKHANLGFFHARNLDFLRYVERATIEFNFNMISPITCSLDALTELTFKNTHRAYSKILKEISAHAPNLNYLEVQFKLTTVEKQLDLQSNSLREIVLIYPVQGLSLNVEGTAEPELDISPGARRDNVTLLKSLSQD